jgi:hypothetical protein
MFQWNTLPPSSRLKNRPRRTPLPGELEGAKDEDGTFLPNICSTSTRLHRITSMKTVRFLLTDSLNSHTHTTLHGGTYQNLMPILKIELGLKERNTLHIQVYKLQNCRYQVIFFIPERNVNRLHNNHAAVNTNVSFLNLRMNIYPPL